MDLYTIDLPSLILFEYQFDVCVDRKSIFYKCWNKWDKVNKINANLAWMTNDDEKKGDRVIWTRKEKS